MKLADCDSFTCTEKINTNERKKKHTKEFLRGSARTMPIPLLFFGILIES